MSFIYVSTGAFKSRNIEEILDVAYKNGIHAIELSAGLNYNSSTLDIVKAASKEFTFLVHNYFPTPKESFCLNLASLDKDIVHRSMNMCRQAIDLVSFFGNRIYSVHCGFTFDGSGKELGNKKQLELPRNSFSEAEKQFIKNLQELCAYAEKYKIKIAIENNVLAGYVSKEQDLYLGVTPDHLSEILNQVNRNNLSILLDLAHAKVSNTFKKFGLHQMVSSLSDKIAIVHVSDNDGRLDQNLKLKKESDLIPLLRRLKDKIIVLESYHLEPEEIKEQIYLIEEVINHGGCEPGL